MSVINSNLFHCSKIGGRSKGFDLPPKALIICGRMNPEALSTVSRLRMAMARHFGARARHTGKTRQPTSGFHSGGGGPRTARTVPFSGRHPASESEIRSSYGLLPESFSYRTGHPHETRAKNGHR